MKKKLIYIILIIVIVLVGVMMIGQSSNQDQLQNNSNNTNNQNTNNNNSSTNENKTPVNHDVKIDKEAKATYDALVEKLNTEVEYFVSEYDMAGNIVEYEMFKAPEHVVSVGRIIDGIDGNIFGINYSYKDKSYDLAIDVDGTYAYEETESQETYTKYMYSDFFSNTKAQVIELKQSKKDNKTIIEIHAILDIEDTTQYLIYLVTINEEGFVDQEEMIVADENFEIQEGADSAIVKFHSYNAKKANEFEDLKDIMKSCKGIAVEEGTKKLAR